VIKLFFCKSPASSITLIGQAYFSHSLYSFLHADLCLQVTGGPKSRTFDFEFRIYLRATYQSAV